MPEREWAEKDYYATLGVQKSATETEIKKAYRKLAQKYHPDANQGDKAAEDKFKEVSHAADVLTDAKTRKEYDDFRDMVNSGFGGFPGGGWGAGSGRAGGGPRIRVEDLGDLGDLFGTNFGGGRGGATEDIFSTIFSRVGGTTRGRDLETDIILTFREALDGTLANLKLTETGTGKQRTLKVRIPAGVKDGARIKVAGKGSPSSNGGQPGDLYVTVGVEPHPVFGRKGKDLTLNLPVTFAEAALGAEVAVPTLDGPPVTLKVPAGTQHGRTFRIRGKGGGGDGLKGDLLVTATVVVPQKLSREGREALERFAEAVPESPREHLIQPTAEGR